MSFYSLSRTKGSTRTSYVLQAYRFRSLARPRVQQPASVFVGRLGVRLPYSLISQPTELHYLQTVKKHTKICLEAVGASYARAPYACLRRKPAPHDRRMKSAASLSVAQMPTCRPKSLWEILSAFRQISSRSVSYLPRFFRAN